MKKILMMGFTPPEEGGSERHIYEISSRMSDAVVFTQKGSLCRNKIEVSTLNYGPILRNTSFLFMSLLFAIYLLIAPKKKYESIHIHENLLYFLAPILRLRYYVVITIHGITGFKFYDHKLLWFFFRSSLRCANKVISVSLADKELLDVELKKVEYIPNGVDLSVYELIGEQKIKKEITFVGRIHEQKGVETLVKAFELVSKFFPEYTLKIIGKKEGNYYEKLRSKYVNKKIVWKGFILDREKLFTEIASSEILVCPSLWEALPWPGLLENLGSGRPVIASSLKGMDKIFRDKKDILLVKPLDVDALSTAMNFLIKHKNVASSIGNNGGRRAEDYRWEIIATKVHRVYK
ncbi:D-inositol-3-phosphate glycosyltransferase [uncultured archaeon]|nr:D-inositol-3-phosphate glycosyltransferase [uncultured archaeon]